MVADLLEAHQKGQDHAASLNAVERVDGRPHLFDRSRVQGGLASTQPAVGVDLSFVGRSAMTRLSVLSRRKTYGCTSLRSGV